MSASTPTSEAAELPPGPPLTDAHTWFRREVHPHDGQLKNYLRSRFPAVRDVDDVVQESYLKIWRARSTRSIESAKAFLFKVARHVALDFLRKGRNSPLQASASSDLLVPDCGPAADQALLAEETLQQLADAVVMLPNLCRQVIILHKIDGIPQKEVACRLGISLRSVEKHCERGMARCEAFLKARGIESLRA
jgi:RNA polymerase sigma factor (sigma-70 family)